MASLLIDTSALLAVLLNEPVRRALISATKGYALVGAPTLPWEVGNALAAGVRRNRLSATDLRQAWVSYQAVPVRLAHIDAGRALDLALEVGLYAYDGYVLETARAERLPLLTLDLSLARAARRLGLRMKEVENEGL
jgi:predicted nucleic acid-binding protein